MAKKTQPELDKKMLSLTQIGVWVGVLGLLTAVILGYLQLRGGGQLKVIERTIRTVFVSTPDKSGDKTSQPDQVSIPAGRSESSGHATSKIPSPASQVPRPPPPPQPDTGAPPPPPQTDTGAPPPPPQPETRLPPPGAGSFKPQPAPSGSGTSTAATPVKPLRDIRIRRDLHRINP